MRRIRRFWTLRHPTATMIPKTARPRMMAMMLDCESVTWIHSILQLAAGVLALES
jgi:hypothetical protein